MTQTPERLVARWATSGKDWLELYETNGSYHYRGRRCGGTLRPLASDAEAIAAMEAPWGTQTGPCTALRSDRPSLRRAAIAKAEGR